MWEYKHPFHGKPHCSSKWKFWILGFCWTCCDCSVFFILSTTNICKVRLTVVVVILCYKVNGKIKTFPSKDETFECMYIIYKCLILGYLHDESAPVLSKINFKNFSFLFSGCENEKVNCCSSSFQTFCKVLYHFFWGAKIYILLSPTFREIEILIPP